MEELGFFETIKLIINNQPGLLAITIALLVAMSGRFGKSIAETIVGIILVFALGLQYLSATKENMYKLETKYSIQCISEKLEAINKDKTLNINELKIDSCEFAEKIKAIKF
jgi:hypothetical protein